MAFNTGNPIGSTDARDLSDNAQNFDDAINDRTNQTWTDRLGVARKTVWGAFSEITYKTPVAYATGISFLTTDANKTVENAGVVYAPLNSALPFTTSGTFSGGDDTRFYPVQDKNNVIRVTTVSAMEALTATSGTQVLVSGSPFKYDGTNWQPTGQVWADAFGNDLQAAGNWMKLDTSRIVYLRDGATYELLADTEYFLARIKCDGLATVVTKEGTILRYDNAVDGSDVFDVEGIQFIVEGNRDSEDLTESPFVYAASASSLKMLRFKRCVAKAIYIPGNYSSWSDTTGKTRAAGFLIATCDDSEVSDISHYGFSLFYMLTPDTSQAIHKESGIHGFNCQTNVFLRVEAGRLEFKYGESLDLSIINTDDEQLFWTGKNEGRVTNGMDTLLSEANHSTKHLVRNISGINNIERSAYLQGSNIDAFGFYDRGSLSGANVKSGVSLQTNNVIRGLTSIDIKNPSANLQFYGENNIFVKDVMSRQTEDSTVRVLSISDFGLSGDVTMTFQGGVITNGAVGFYLSNDYRIESLSISDYEFINVYQGSAGRASVLEYRTGDLLDIGKIQLENLVHTVDKGITGSQLPNASYAFKNCEEIYINNCTGVSGRIPFNCDNVDYAKITNCNFEIRSNVSEEAAFNVLDDSSFVATKFDFVIDILGAFATADNKVLSVKVARNQETGMVKCIDYWTEIKAGLTPPSNATSFQSLVDLTGYSFRVSAFRDGDSITFDYDGIAAATSNVVINGSLFSNTSNSLFRVYINDGVVVLRTGSTSLTVGDISIRVSRL